MKKIEKYAKKQQKIYEKKAKKNISKMGQRGFVELDSFILHPQEELDQILDLSQRFQFLCENISFNYFAAKQEGNREMVRNFQEFNQFLVNPIKIMPAYHAYYKKF